jgi:hypothetical protein
MLICSFNIKQYNIKFTLFEVILFIDPSNNFDGQLINPINLCLYRFIVDIFSEIPVLTYNRKFFYQGLTDNNPVKWIAMVKIKIS